MSSPPQIFQPIVGALTVYMINRWFVLWIWYECLCNKLMHTPPYSFTLFPKMHSHISVVVYIWNERLSTTYPVNHAASRTFLKPASV